MKKKENYLPKNAKKVFKGEIFEVWQWKQKMFDGTVEIFEKVKRPDTVQIIPTVANRIMIQYQEQPDRPPFLTLAGGRVDVGETPLSAAKRELKEETGYSSKNWLFWKKENPQVKIISTVYTFIARNCDLESEPSLDAGEKIKVKPITFNEFLMLSENKSFRNRDIVILLLKLRLDPKKKKEFYNLLFPKQS